MDVVVSQIEQIVELAGFSLAHGIESAVDYFIMYPWTTIVAGILAYLAAMRAMCR